MLKELLTRAIDAERDTILYALMLQDNKSSVFYEIYCDFKISRIIKQPVGDL